MLIKITEALIARCAKQCADYRPRPAWLDAFIRERMSRPLVRGIHWGDRRGKLPPWQHDKLKTGLLLRLRERQARQPLAFWRED